MKFKTVLVFALLVTASLVSFSNKCRPVCDGRKMIVLTEQCSNPVQAPTSSDKEAAGTSPLLRIAVTL